MDDRNGGDGALRVLMITSEWPTPDRPSAGGFIQRQAEALRAEGVEIDVFPFRGTRKLGNYLKAWWGVQRRISVGRYDLVHAQWGQSALPALPKRCPLVVTFRGSDVEGDVGRAGRYTAYGWVLRAVSKMAARLADERIVVSTRLVRHLPAGRFHVIPSGLDLDLFRPMPREEARLQLGLPAGRRLVLFAASPQTPVKRFHLAQQAVGRLKKAMDVELIACHNVPHTMMPHYLNASDALLLTSRHEGSPNVVKEALACNIPVVSVDVGDVSERIGSIEGCVICKDDHPRTIAGAITSVLEKNSRIDGRAAVVDLDERRLAAKIISVYRRAVSQG